MDQQRVKMASYKICALVAQLDFDEALSVLGVVVSTVLQTEPDEAYRRVMAEEFASRLVNHPGLH